MNVETIMNRIKAGDTFLNAFEVTELELSLTCNLSDIPTVTYAKENFYSFYESKIKEYKQLNEDILSCDLQATNPEYLTKFANSVEILELAFELFKKRMEKVNINE